jgi:hypothetical protein
MATEWTRHQESLLVAWAEKASGSAWLHSHSSRRFRRHNHYIVLPACLMGYAAGATSLLSQTASPATRAVTGVCGLLAGMLVNFQELFKFKELAEQHRMASLRFLTFFRDVSCELSMHPDHRSKPSEYINLKRMELDKLHEQMPDVPPFVVELFDAKFGDAAIHKPDAACNLQTVLPYGARPHSRIGLVEVANAESPGASEGSP